MGFQQRDRLTLMAESAESRGELKTRRLAPVLPEPASPSAKNITVRVPEQVLARARELAAKRGLRYQTYVKMLLDEALDNEEKRLAR